MRTIDFIDALERRRVVDAELGRQLRAKVDASDHTITPDGILSYLVKKQVISPQQSEELSESLLSVLASESEILNLMPLTDSEEDDAPAWVPRPASPPSAAAPPAPPPLAFAPRATDDDQFFESRTAKPSDPRSLASRPEPKGPAGVYRLGGDKKKGRKKRTAGGKSQWDSPLLLLGGGALALLVVGGAFLYYLLIRENADAVLADAERLFKSGAYSQAIDRYQQFVDNFPNHKDASLAKVRLEMTRLWQTVEGMRDPADGLEAAKQTITEIEDEPAFISDAGGGDELSAAKQELSTLLTRIARALVNDADKSRDEAIVKSRIEQVEEALALSANTKYVPEKFRNGPELAAIAESLEVVRSRQSRDSRLTATLDKMDAAIAGGDTVGAFAARLDLLSDYPALADDEDLAAKVREVSAAEQAAVKYQKQQQAAETSWAESPIVAQLALAERRGPTGAPADGDPVVVRVDGSLFGLRSGDGALLWRRFAGAGETTPPLKVQNGGVIAADLNAGELWRLDAATGNLVWRLALDDKVVGVAVAGAQLLATSESGKLFVVDAESGGLAGRVDFTQPIRLPPAVNDRGDRAYVVAEHSVIYSLSTDDFSCLGVYYMGHAAGSIAAPPLAVLNKVIVAENVGDACQLRILAVNDVGAIAAEAAGHRLDGVALTPLATGGRRLALATTRGQVTVFEISAAPDKSSLTVVARRPGQDAEPTARFGLLHDGHLWLAARQLAKLAILPTENQLSVRSLDHDYHGDAFDAPLMIAGGKVIHVRRPAGRAGVVVAAIDASADRTVWETELAAPPAGAPAVDARRMQISTVTANGAAYLFDRQALTRRVNDQPTPAPAASTKGEPFTDSIDLGDGRLAAFAVGGARVLMLRPGEALQPIKLIELAAPLTCPLAPWRGGFVAATAVGQVFVFDGERAASAGTPFQPELTTDREYQWLEPAVVGEGDASRLALSDGAGALHVLEWKTDPTPHLDAIKTVAVGASPLATRLAAVGSRVFAGTADGKLAAFELSDLTAVDAVDLGSPVAWGPYVAGDGALLSTDAGELVMIGGDGAVHWRRPLEHGPLASRPSIAKGSATVLHAAGGLERINLSDGAEAGYADLGQPAIAGPAALGERFVVAAPDGTLLIVNQP